MAVEIIAKHDVFSGYKQTETYRNAVRQIDAGQLERLQKFRQIQQVEQLQQLERLQQLGQLEITNKDYRAFSEVKGAVFYLDPPYENSDVDGYSDSKQFSHAEFYDWSAEMARENIVLLSGYTVSDDRFVEVFRFKTALSTLCGGRDKSRFEKLFMLTSFHP
mgnify:CR=1 FL=1